jgi:uncharacterized protein
MAQATKGQEPSMEEILASIRKIIADDEPAPTSGRDTLFQENIYAATEPAISSTPRAGTLPPRRSSRAVMEEVRAAGAGSSETVEQPEDIDKILAQLQATSMKQPGVPMEKPATDILELTDEMASPPEAPSPPPVLERAHERLSEPQPSAREFVDHARQETRERGLVSAATSAAVDSAFNTLAQTVLVQNGRTLEDLVKEMLRPLLKTWLDDNLPSLVERLVRAEIERVSRGRG